MKVAIGADHAGYALKQELVKFLQASGHDVTDCGIDTAANSVDYPDFAKMVGELVQEGKVERGILLCGSGVGICIAAGKMHGIYAAICHDIYSAHQGVEHDRMNVLCLGAKVIGIALAQELVIAFLNAHFIPEERYERRYHKVQQIENAVGQ